MTKEKYLVMRDRPSMLTPVYWNIITQTSPITEKIYKIKLSIEFNYFKSYRMKSIFLKNDWEKVGNHIAKNMLNKKYFDNIEREIKKGIKEIKKFLKEIKKKRFFKLSFDELISLANKLQKVWLSYDIPNVYSWLIGGDKFKEMIDNLLNLPNEDFLFLTIPKEKTFVSKLEFDLLKFTKLVKEKKKKIENITQKLSDDYGWIPFGYDGLEYWDKDYFLKKLKNNVKNYSRKIDENLKQIEKEDKKNLIKRNRIIKKFKLNKKQLELINKINILALWTDERKNLEFRLYYYYSQILLELEKRYNIPYKNLKYLFIEELQDIKNNRGNILKITNDRINNGFMIEARNGKIKILSKDKRDKILREIEKQIKRSDIKGIVASKGIKSIYKGKVKIVLSPKEGNKVNKNDFLVATMTSPDYITSMKKAKGFITDEGGITCHAAIVAREMNKPCIIGTKNATKILKDNDLIEVDANRGIVRKLK